MAEDEPRYGVCPNGHGDGKGIIAAEVSADAHPYPNCPICGTALEYADACLDDHAWCVGPEGPEVDAPWGGKCSTCYCHPRTSEDTAPTEPTETTTVKSHPGATMQAHTPLKLLQALGVAPGDELEWYYMEGQPVAIVRNPDG